MTNTTDSHPRPHPQRAGDNEAAGARPKGPTYRLILSGIIIGILFLGTFVFGLISGAGGLALLMNVEPGLACDISGGSYNSQSRRKGICAYRTEGMDSLASVVQGPEGQGPEGQGPEGQGPEGQGPEVSPSQQFVEDSHINAPVEDPPVDDARVQAPLTAADVLWSLLQANLPWTGPHDAEIFFFTFEDYQCPHCRNMHEARVAYYQDSAIPKKAGPKKAGPKKAAFIHLPIGRINALSDIGARIAIAGWLLDPTRFDVLQEALFASTSPTDLQNRLTAINFSYVDLLAASHQPQLNAIIEGIAAMASGLDIRGTPTTLAWDGRDRVLTLRGSMSTEEIVAAAEMLSVPEIVGIIPPNRGEGTN